MGEPTAVSSDLYKPQSWQDVAEAIAAVERKDLLFVTGAVKSGTTWTQLWLDRHPEVACRGEGMFFNRFAGALQGICADSNRVVAAQNAHKGDKDPAFPEIGLPHIVHLLRQTVLGVLAGYGLAEGVRVVAEKTPSTVLGLDTVFLAFPDARVLHLIRDGRDVAISAWHDNVRKAGQGFLQQYPTFGTFLPDMAQIWVNHQTPVLDAPEGRRARILTLHYEDLLADGAAAMRRIFEQLGVAADDETVAACLAATSFETLADGRKPGEEDKGSFFRKGTAGQWRETMTEEQEAKFWEIAGATMTRLGYGRDGQRTG
jgi:hypothetical protein